MTSSNRTPETGRGRQAFALPHSFHPDLGLVEALLAVAGTLARIFGACLLFAFWGGLSAWTWTAIPSHFWRVAAVGPLVAVFPVVLAGLLMGVGALQKRLRPATPKVRLS